MLRNTLLSSYSSTPVIVMTDDKIKAYLQLIEHYEKWRKWTGKWLFSWQVLFTFTDPKQILIDQIKQLLNNAAHTPINILFKNLIDFYIADIWMELDINSLNCVGGGGLRKIIAEILLDIYQQPSAQKKLFESIIVSSENQFKSSVQSYNRHGVYITPGRYPIKIDPTEDLLKSYEPIGITSFRGEMQNGCSVM
jgi:hypothetical protein